MPALIRWPIEENGLDGGWGIEMCGAYELSDLHRPSSVRNLPSTMPPSIAALETTNAQPSSTPKKLTHGPTSITTDRPMDTLTIGNRAGTIHMPTIPIFPSPHDEREWALEHMAGAFRLFGKFSFGEGAAGHISLRDPVNPGWMWINPYGVHFSQICKRDLVCVDEEGFVVGEVGAQKPVNTAGVHIHRELHRARPDIKAACHAHSIHGKAWSAFGRELEMINQESCIFYKQHTVVPFGGLVLGAEEGKRIGAALGQSNKAVILENHGLLTVGQTVDEAAYRHIIMERTCQAQLLAEAAAANGIKKNIIRDEDAKYTADALQEPESLYFDFMTEYNLLLEESNGAFLK